MTQSSVVFLSGLAILGLLFWYVASDVERRKRNIGSILIGGIIALCVWALVPRTDPETGDQMSPLNLGIDLAGGSAFTVKVQAKVDDQTGEAIPVDKFAVTQAIETLRGRLDPQGNKDVLFTPQGEDRILIQIPGSMTDEEAERVRDLIRKTASLELRAVSPESSEALAERVRSGDTLPPRAPGSTSTSSPTTTVTRRPRASSSASASKCAASTSKRPGPTPPARA